MSMEEARELLLSRESSNIDQGRGMVESLAREGNSLAKYAIATWHISGANNYPIDFATAETLLREAAAAHVPEACYDLAVQIEKYGHSKNRRREAFGWYVLGALLGDADCVRQVDRCFHWGIGTFRNIDIARNIRKLESGTSGN